MNATNERKILVHDIFNYEKDLNRYKKIFESKKHLISDNFENSIFYKTLIKDYEKAQEILNTIYSFNNLKSMEISEKNEGDYLIKFLFDNNVKIKFSINKNRSFEGVENYSEPNLKEFATEIFTTSFFDSNINYNSKNITNKNIYKNLFKIENTIKDSCYALVEIYNVDQTKKHTLKSFIEAGCLFQVIHDKIIINEDIKQQINKRENNGLKHTL